MKKKKQLRNGLPDVLILKIKQNKADLFLCHVKWQESFVM